MLAYPIQVFQSTTTSTQLFLVDVFHTLRIGLGYLFSPPIPNPGFFLETKSSESETCFLLLDILEMYPTKTTAVHHESSWLILNWISSRSWNKENGNDQIIAVGTSCRWQINKNLPQSYCNCFNSCGLFEGSNCSYLLRYFHLNSYPPWKAGKIQCQSVRKMHRDN